jgi:predicted transglutaminase-like cysteine proteinase
MLVRIARAIALAGFVSFGAIGLSASADPTAIPNAHEQDGLSIPALAMAPPFNAEGERARAPMGWTGFCERYSDECLRESFSGEKIAFEGAVRDLIVRVNEGVNRAISPATDRLQWGLEERWDFAETGAGDCEDYVLLKQRWLVFAGLPRQALLITVVTDLSGDGHAVLTIHTDRGDYILDNMRDEIKLWRETPYTFVKRQSRFVSDGWVALNASGSSTRMVSR